jgi:hypothetical protein
VDRPSPQHYTSPPVSQSTTAHRSTMKPRYALLTLIVIILGLIVFHGPILGGAGRFMAPRSESKAQVLIVEGEAVVKNGALYAAMGLLSQGKANRMVVVLHKPLKESGQVFALQEKYTQLIIDEVKRLGFQREKVEVISAPITGHPITLSEARYVVAKLSRDRVRTAILLSSGFHTRRSVGVYRQEGVPLGLHIVPYPYFIDYESDSWWHESQGIGDFIQETAKLAYYVGRGYLSVKYLRD